MDFATRVDTMILAACNGDLATARELLDAEPEIARANFYAACAAGEAEAAARYPSREPELARTSGGPETLKPLLYLCYSRFLSDPQRAPGMLRIARLLLDNGADPNSFFVSPDDGKSRRSGARRRLPASTAIPNSPACCSSAARIRTTKNRCTTPPRVTIAPASA